MGATLTEVAQAAGVSLATASRAFKAPERLAASTRARVLQAAADLKYDGHAVSIRTFAIVVPDVSNPIFASLIAAIQEKAWAGRNHMLLYNTAEHPSIEAEVLRSLGPGVSGVILASPRMPADELEGAMGTTPLVVMNSGVKFCPSVLLDADTGLEQAFEHLGALGHHHLAYAPGPKSAWANQRREALVRESAQRWGMRLDVVGHQAASVDGGLAAAASVVASGATAVIAYNDLVALGVRAGARAMGKECPRDLSIVGIDDLDVAAVSEPSLTTVRLDITDGGARAYQILADMVAGKKVPLEPEHRPSQLIVRHSTTLAKSARLTHGSDS